MMQLYSYEVSGTRAASQSNAGTVQTFFWCRAYSDEQALAWAKERAGSFLHSLHITKKKAVP